MMAILVTLVALGQMAFNIFLPSLPEIGREFSKTPSAVQYTITCYLAAFAIGQLFIGALSDRFGRKPVLLAGIALYAASSLICVFATSLPMLITGRIVQALGGCAGMVLARAIIRDMNEQDEAASMLGYVTMTMMAVPSLAPAFGGVIEVAFGWRANFWVLVAIGIATALAVAARLPETNFNRTRSLRFKAQFQNYAQLVKSAPFMGYALTASFASSMFFTYASASPHIGIKLLGLSPAEYGLYFAFAPAGFITGNFLSGRLSVTFGTDRMITAGNLLALVATLCATGLALAGIFTPFALFAPFFFVAISNGLTVTNGVAGAISVHPELAGTAAGLAGFMQWTAASFFVWLVGTLQGPSQLPMILIVFGCALGALASGGFTRIARARQPGQAGG